MLTVLTIAGGVALILFGVRYLRKGLDRLFGPRLGYWIQRLARNRLRAFFTGLGVSILAPSSTTVSVLAVQTVQAGHLNARQTLAMLIGADIGLTVMVILIALGQEQVAPALILAGVFLHQYTRATRSRGVGQVLLAIGFIFMGIITIRRGAPVENAGDLAKLLVIAESYPLFMALLAALMALALQSSTATISLVIALGAVESVGMPLPVALCGVIGANVGIGITTLGVGWRQVESRRLAMGNLIAKAFIAVVALASLPWIKDALAEIGDGLSARIAIAHCGFNLALAVVALPLVPQIHALTQRLFPDPSPSQVRKFGPRHLPPTPPDGVALAMGLAMREIMHVAEITRSMLSDLWSAMESDDEALCRQVSKRDDQVDELDTTIKQYLTKLAAQGLDQDEAAEQMRQLRYLTELETIGDVIDKNLSELVLKKIRLRATFSAQGAAELDDFYSKVSENLLIADTAFTIRDRELADQLLRHKEHIDTHERRLRDSHFERLNAGQIESQESSAIHLDILSQLKRINSCVSHVAYSIIQDTTGSKPAGVAKSVE